MHLAAITAAQRRAWMRLNSVFNSVMYFSIGSQGFAANRFYLNDFYLLPMC